MNANSGLKSVNDLYEVVAADELKKLEAHIGGEELEMVKMIPLYLYLESCILVPVNSVTRLGDLLDFGQQLTCPNLPHSSAIFVKVSKSIIFLVNSFWATFIDIWQFFLVTLSTTHLRPSIRILPTIASLTDSPGRLLRPSVRSSRE